MLRWLVPSVDSLVTPFPFSAPITPYPKEGPSSHPPATRLRQPRVLVSVAFSFGVRVYPIVFPFVLEAAVSEPRRLGPTVFLLTSRCPPTVRVSSLLCLPPRPFSYSADPVPPIQDTV